MSIGQNTANFLNNWQTKKGAGHLPCTFFALKIKNKDFIWIPKIAKQVWKKLNLP